MNLNLGINVKKVIAYTEALDGKIPYGWGDKVEPTATLEEFLKTGAKKGVDCSGFIAWVIAQASNQNVILPTYSVSIGDYLKKVARQKGTSSQKYTEVAGLHDNTLRIAGFDLGGTSRHVWAVYNGLTCESHGGSTNRGVDRRPWNANSLSKAQWCFAVAAGTSPTVAESTTKPSAPTVATKPVVNMPYPIVLRDARGVVLERFPNAVEITKDGRAIMLAKILPKIVEATVEFKKGELNVYIVNGDENAPKA